MFLVTSFYTIHKLEHYTQLIHLLSHNVPHSFIARPASTKNITIYIIKATNTASLILGLILLTSLLLYIHLYLSVYLYLSIHLYLSVYWLHWSLNRCTLSHMTFTSCLVGVAFDYTVHMILTSYLVGVAYDYTVYQFEHYTGDFISMVKKQ